MLSWAEEWAGAWAPWAGRAWGRRFRLRLIAIHSARKALCGRIERGACLSVFPPKSTHYPWGMSDCEKNTKEPITDEERILLFEWHARHLESWWDTIRPKKFSINFPRGLQTPDFHLLSASLLLLRKFYTKGHEVKLPLVYDSIINKLPEEEKQLRRTLKEQKHQVTEYLRQSVSVHAPDSLRPDQVMYEVAYGLLIHSDVDRHKKLADMSRSWMHEMIIAGEGEVPVLRTLATIRRCRSEGTLDLPEPYEAIWEPKEPEGMDPDQALEFLRQLGFDDEDGNLPIWK